MNLRVDLITVEEQRSASPVRLGFLLRIAGIVMVVLVLGAIVFSYYKLTETGRELASVIRRLEETEDQYNEAVVLQQKFDQTESTRADLVSLRDCRIVWNEHLAAFQKIVPEFIQVTQFDVGMQDKGSTRLFRVKIGGRAVGDNPEQDVSVLERLLTEDEYLKNYIASAKVPPGRFVEGRWPGAEDTDRQFEIMCEYKPIVFK